MPTSGPVLTRRDFDILEIPGFAERMAALRQHLSPKLEAVGEALRPELETRIGQAFHSHVARHARRRVNPPSDTWVALSESRRGYKMLPHFEIGLFSDHVFLRVGVIYEAEDRSSFAEVLAESLGEVPDRLRIVFDHQKPGGHPVAELRREPDRIVQAVRRKAGEVLLELPLPVDAVAGQDLAALLRPELPPFTLVYHRWRVRQPVLA